MSNHSPSTGETASSPDATVPAPSTATAPSSASAAARQAKPSGVIASNGSVTLRSFVLGAIMTAGLAALNTSVEDLHSVHFLGGVPMPMGAIFSMLLVVVLLNGPLKSLAKDKAWGPLKLRAFSPTELIVVYVMTLFGSLLSTPGCDNFFLTTGTALFYYTSRENGWADLFYKYIPTHFAPGWDGHTFQHKVIDPLFLGGLSYSQIPWHAWVVMLASWGIFLSLIYVSLFFLGLLFRRQWIENEALTFPLVQLPLQMVELTSPIDGSSGRGFWSDVTMWSGVSLTFVVHALRGLNWFFPDWPIIPSFQGNSFYMSITDQPWNSMGHVSCELFFGAIGVAYLLTRELSFSFWFFYFVFKAQLLMATLSGYPALTLPKDTYLGQPRFISWQGAGGWLMTGALLLWSARGHIQQMWRAALKGGAVDRDLENEPFSPRCVLVGLAASSLGLLAWGWFSGINPVVALFFFALYGITSLVLARLVVEGGFIFPQTTFGALEILNGSALSAGFMGSATITRVSFLQPMLFMDMRANVLPGFLHTLKMANSLGLDRRDTRRLLGSALVAIALALAVSTVMTLGCLYKVGGLAVYGWFTSSGPQSTFSGAATMIKTQPHPEVMNWFWLSVGGAIVLLLTMARSRLFWFPLHPLGYLVCAGYPITRLWLSFFIGWLVKSLLLKFGGQDAAAKVRPFMIGLIIGNAMAMVGWMMFGFYMNNQIPYWPA